MLFFIVGCELEYKHEYALSQLSCCGVLCVVKSRTCI